MAYTPNNLALVFEPIGGMIGRLFVYADAAPESDATIVGGGFFSDGVTKGMRVGDLVDVVQYPTAKFKRYQCASVSGAAATVAAPTAIT